MAVFYCNGCKKIRDYHGGHLCLACESENEGKRSEIRAPQVIVKAGRGDPGDLDYRPEHLGGDASRGARTPEEQERVYRDIYLKEQKAARDVAENRKGTRRSDTEFRKIATIPREAFEAEKHEQDNKCAWMDGGKDLLKKKGWLYDHEES